MTYLKKDVFFSSLYRSNGCCRTRNRRRENVVRTSVTAVVTCLTARVSLIGSYHMHFDAICDLLLDIHTLRNYSGTGENDSI